VSGRRSGKVLRIASTISLEANGAPGNEVQIEKIIHGDLKLAVAGFWRYQIRVA
jgi:hypothetical protein